MENPEESEKVEEEYFEVGDGDRKVTGLQSPFYKIAFGEWLSRALVFSWPGLEDHGCVIRMTVDS